MVHLLHVEDVEVLVKTVILVVFSLVIFLATFVKSMSGIFSIKQELLKILPLVSIEQQDNQKDTLLFSTAIIVMLKKHTTDIKGTGSMVVPYTLIGMLE